MIGQHLAEFFQSLRIEAFDGPADLLVDLLPPVDKQAVVGDLLNQGMSEDVLQVGEKALLVDEFQPLKVDQAGFEFLFHLGDRFQDAKGKFPPDHRGHLHDPLEAFLQTVHAGRDDPLNRVRDLGTGDIPRQDKPIILFLDGAVLKQGMGKLLHEQRVAGGPVEDQFPQLGHHVSTLQDRCHQFRARARGELPHPDHAVIGFAPPLMGIFGPVEKQEENAGPWEPADHVVQELFRGLVDPVQVFNGQDQRPILAASNQQVPEGLKGLFSFLLRLQLGEFFIIDLQRQEFLKWRDDVSKVLVQPEDSLLQLLPDYVLLLAFFDSDEGPGERPVWANRASSPRSEGIDPSK